MDNTWLGLADLVSGNGLTYVEEAAQFTLAGWEKLMERMRTTVRAEPDVVFLSPTMARRLRRFERLKPLYAATALPKYKLRKCEERKVLARRKQGRLRIARLERAEEQRLRDTRHPQCRCAPFVHTDESLGLADCIDRTAWDAYKEIEPRYSEANQRLASSSMLERTEDK